MRRAVTMLVSPPVGADAAWVVCAGGVCPVK
jgi:hypothetical protein